jgi:predicted GNAT family N-acyltransferase
VPSQIDISKFQLERISDDYSIKPFDCDDADLNDFILNDAKGYLKELLAVTYVLEDAENNATVAFFSMFNDRISLNETTSSSWNRLRRSIPNPKRKSSFPAVKLGRLGVSNEYKGNGIGKLILDYIKLHFVTNNRTGCRFLTVDAYAKSLGFYEKQGFIYFTESDSGQDTRQMYFDLYRLV